MLKTAIAGTLPKPLRLAKPGKLSPRTACGLTRMAASVERGDLQTRAERAATIRKEIRP